MTLVIHGDVLCLEMKFQLLLVHGPSGWLHGREFGQGKVWCCRMEAAGEPSVEELTKASVKGMLCHRWSQQ